MKNIKIAGIAALAGLLVGCANNTTVETNGASYVESSSSVESTTSSVESSSVQSSSSSTTSSSSSSAESSSSSSTSSEISSSSSVESSVESSSSSSAESKPQSSSSKTPESKPVQSSSSSAVSSSSSSTTTPTPVSSGNKNPWTVISAWNPNAPGNKPGPYGGYYDANGYLHCTGDEVPKDEKCYPTVGYYDEYGYYQMTQEEVNNAPPPPYPNVLPESQRTQVIREWNPDAAGNTPGEYGGYYDVEGNLHCAKADVPWRGSYRAVSFIDEKGKIHLSAPYWNPNDIGTTPGPYGGYYDAEGNLHCKEDNVPRDACGYPVVCFRDEYGGYMTYVEKQKARAEEDRLWQGGIPDTSGLDLSEWTW